MQDRIKVLAAAGVLVALGVAGCSGDDDASGRPGDNGPAVPTFSGSVSQPTAPTAPTGPPGTVGPPTTGTEKPVPPPAVDPPEPGLTGECKSPELRLSLGPGEGAAGTVFRPLQFTNIGTRTCPLQGYPGVSYVAGDDGHQVGPAAFREGRKGPAVTLAPGETAFAMIGFVNVNNFDPSACKPTGVRGLRVYPPHETASLFVPMEGTGCAGTPPDPQLTVKTMEKGGGGY